MKHKRLVAEWVEKAEGDFRVMQRELRSRRDPCFDAVCYVIEQELDLHAAIARDAGIVPDALSGFLEGTRGLPSESLDRLAIAAGVVVTMMQPE
jgi:hypothetical protein